jgi:hypothetical protein
MTDTFTEALNSPVGHLAAVLLRKVPDDERYLTEDLRDRLTRLIDAPEPNGKLVRVRLAAEVAFLFSRIPNWTKKHVTPLFFWDAADAPNAWEARKYSRAIGAPELFGILKEPFLAMFGNQKISSHDVRIFAEWLVPVLLHNQHAHAEQYPLSKSEARTALRKTDAGALASVARRMANEMASGPEAGKLDKWRNIVGPVFQGIWPLDIEMQSNEATHPLVSLLCTSGEAFVEAAVVIIPFVRPEQPGTHMSLFKIGQAPDNLFSMAPETMLDLIVAVAGDAPPNSGFGLEKAISRLRAAAPSITNTRKFQRLLSYAS